MHLRGQMHVNQATTTAFIAVCIQRVYSGPILRYSGCDAVELFQCGRHICAHSCVLVIAHQHSHGHDERQAATY